MPDAAPWPANRSAAGRRRRGKGGGRQTLRLHQSRRADNANPHRSEGVPTPAGDPAIEVELQTGRHSAAGPERRHVPLRFAQRRVAVADRTRERRRMVMLDQKRAGKPESATDHPGESPPHPDPGHCRRCHLAVAEGDHRQADSQSDHDPPPRRRAEGRQPQQHENRRGADQPRSRAERDFGGGQGRRRGVVEWDHGACAVYRGMSTVASTSRRTSSALVPSNSTVGARTTRWRRLGRKAA